MKPGLCHRTQPLTDRAGAPDKAALAAGGTFDLAAGTYTSTNSLSFSGIEDLTGGAGADGDDGAV